MEWDKLNEKQKMEWYQEYWKQKNPTFTKCDLLQNESGNWILRVDKPDWRKNGGTTKYVVDADYAWKKQQIKKTTPKVEQPQVVVAPAGGNLNVSLTPNKEKKEAKTFKTVSCVLDMDFYNKVQSVCEKNNMNTNELIRHLLKQVIDK